MKLLFLGGPLDGQLKETEEKLSPLVPMTIKVTLPSGGFKVYTVHFFAGEKVQFPLACYEGLTADDIFKMLLQWYAIKPHVQRIPAKLPEPDSQSMVTEQEETDSGDEVVSESSTDPVVENSDA